jgi:DNA-binding transcriptional MerR regulator
MSKYTMAQIVTLTGINAHTLRKWETRYSIIEPERTDTNIRYYSDSQLKKLLNISLLTKNGYRISKIDKMSETEIHDAVTSQITDENYEVEINALIASMLDMDEIAFDKVVKEQIIKKGLLVTTVEIIYPFLHQVGVLWGVDKVMPAQEHFISSLIKKRFFSSIDQLSYPKDNAKSIVMFLTEYEHHELGLLLAYYVAREMGWKVYYLGQNVPVINLKQVIQDVNPDAMLTMFVTPIHKTVLPKIDDLCSYSDIPLCVSGNPENLEDIIEDKRITYLSRPEDFIEFLKKEN